MMKKANLISRLLSLFLTISLTVSHSDAATLIWAGGNGNWFDGSNWNTGTIPTLRDDVFINSGNVIINNYEAAEASELNIEYGASLEIEGTGSLTIELDNYTSGILNYGYVGNKGSIFISNPFSHSQSGIYNYGIFINSGNIQTKDLGHGIINYSGDFTNSGVIEIFDISGYGANALTNWENFSNTKYARIEIHDVGGTAGTLTNTGNGYFGNAGDIEIYDLSNSSTSSLSVVSGLFENLNGGNVEIMNTDGQGINVSNNGILRNRSQLSTYNTGHQGILITGFFVNHQAGYISNFYNGADAMVIYPGGEFRNFGLMINNWPTGRSLTNQGIFNNYPKGYFIHDNQILSGTGANLINQGHWESYHTGSHIISGPFTNNTVIGDRNEGFQGEITNNQGIRIHPMAGLVEVGEPYPNLFDMGTLNSITIIGITGSPSSTTSVGTYNATNNSFIPNSNALGLTAVYVNVTVNSGGNGRKYMILIPGGVQPAPSPRVALHNAGDLTIEERAPFPSKQESETRLYPNPNQGDFNLEIPFEKNQVSSLGILNGSGQVVYQINPASLTVQNQIRLPKHLPAGTYILKIKQEDGGEEIKKFQVFR